MEFRSGMVGPGYGYGYPPVTTFGPDAGKAMDPITLLMALRRRWFLALFLGLLCAAVAAATTWHVWPPNLPAAQATLFVNSEPPYILNPGPDNTNFQIYRKTQQAILRSRVVLQAALNRPEVAELNIIKRLNGNALTYLESSLGAEYATAPEILTVYLAGPPDLQPEDEEELTKLLAGVIDAYLGDMVHIQHNSKYRRKERLEEIREDISKILRKKQDTLVALSTAMGTHDPHVIQSKHEFALQELNSARQEQMAYAQKKRQKTIELKIKMGKLKQISDVPIGPGEIDDIVNKDPEIQDLSKDLADAINNKTQTAKLSPDGKNGPDYKEFARQEASLRNQLDKRRGELVPDATEEIRHARQGELESEVILLEDEIHYLDESEKEVQKLVEALVEASRSIGLGSAEIDDLKQEIAGYQDKMGDYSDRIDAIELELHAADRVTKIDDPVFWPASVGKKQLVATWGAGLGAFSLILFGVSWWEFRARRISTVDEIVHGLGIKLVGALPALPDRRARALPSRDPFYPNYLIESVDTTRTMLLHAARQDRLQAVLVTSARPGEGKTSLSVQLAASLARAGRKTLFIDGDLRNPAAHQLFNVALTPGLSELVRGEADVNAVIQPTSVRNLWMVPAGRWTAQATEALAQETLRPILERLKAEFDLIIVDSSPVLAVVDGLLIAQQVDAAIFSILNEVSHSPSVYAAYQRLEGLGVRILGAVVNGLTTHQFGYKSDYTYGSGSNRGENQPLIAADAH
jgi:capsular exopolysaccharide synthesis family protein